jgi:copper oxidase (laccase) domain-containing protein
LCFAAGLPIAVTSADCVPVLAARRDGRAVAALHAGWRGTLAGAAGSSCARSPARGEDPAQWIAAIGPAIGPCCYEVSEELAAEFGSPQTRMLDLPALNAAQLRAAGIGEVELLRACTRCSLERARHAALRELPARGRAIAAALRDRGAHHATRRAFVAFERRAGTVNAASGSR